MVAVAALVSGAGTAVAGAAPAGEPPPGTVPQLAWTACGITQDATAAGVECATADLPLDHDEPEGAQVQVAMARVPATDPANRIGSLFVNPGGPGGAVVEYLQVAGSGLFADLNARFDIVGFDPRGVGQSRPAIDCQVDPETQGLYAGPVPTPLDIDVAAYVARAQDYVDACLTANGDILEHVSTANVARDLDLLRAAVGDEQLTYLGYSYGTFLGATYAALFPDRYRALVLDGALDPEQYVHDPEALRTAQAGGFEDALDRFLAACAADQVACSGFGGADPAAAYDELLATAAQTPIPAAGFVEDPRPVTPDEVLAVTAQLLYGKQAWGVLAAALAGAQAGDATLFRALYNTVVDQREPDGSPDPFPDRFRAINAADQEWPRDVDAFLARADRDRMEFPHFGGFHGDIVQVLWPVDDEDAYGGPFAVDPSAPAPLVVGTTHDPATPYSGAEALAEQLGNAALLTMDGDGHTAYGGNSACIDRATEAYLLDLTLPPVGTVCAQEVPFVAPAPAPAEAGPEGRTAVELGLAALTSVVR